MLVRPDLDRMVEVDEPDVAPNHPREHAHDHPGEDECGERHGERQARGRRRVHPGAQEPPRPTMAAQVLAQRLGGAERGVGVRPAADRQGRAQTRGSAHHQHEDQDHHDALSSELVLLARFPRWRSVGNTSYGRDRTLRAETRAPRTPRPAVPAPVHRGSHGRGGRLRHHDAPPRGLGPPVGQRAPRRGGRPMGRLGQSLVRAAEDPDARRPIRLGVPPRRHVHGDRHRGRRGRDARDRAPLGPDRLPGRRAAHRTDDLRDDRVPGRTSPSRGPSTRRGTPHLELPVRTHGRLDRAVRGSRAHRDVARPQHPRPGGRVVPGRRPPDRRRSLAVVSRDASPDRRDRERDRRGGMSGVRAPRDPHRPRGGRTRGRDERERPPSPIRVPVGVPTGASGVEVAP